MQENVMLQECNIPWIAAKLIGKCEGYTPLGRPRLRWEGNSIIDVREVGYRLHLSGPGRDTVVASCDHKYHKG
jgi:hypothetical protein